MCLLLTEFFRSAEPYNLNFEASFLHGAFFLSLSIITYVISFRHSKYSHCNR